MNKMTITNIMKSDKWSDKCKALDTIYDKCEKALPFIFTKAKKHNKINSLKKSLKGGYEWGSYSTFNSDNTFNNKNNDIQYFNYIFDSLDNNNTTEKVVEKVVEKEVIVEKVVGRYDHYKESTWNELVAKTKENKKLKKRIKELESVEKPTEKVEMIITDLPVTNEIQTQTEEISEEEKDNSWWNYSIIKNQLEEMTKIRFASQKKNERLQKEIEEQKLFIQKLKEGQGSAKPDFDIPVIDGEPLEVCSSTTIRYKNEVYWTKSYIDKKLKRANEYGVKMNNKWEDCKYDLDKAQMNLKNYQESFRELKKERDQLSFKLDKGEMYTKKDLMEKIDSKDREITRLQNEVDKQDGRQELSEVKYENSRLGGILLERSQTIKKLETQLKEQEESLQGQIDDISAELQEKEEYIEKCKEYGCM